MEPAELEERLAALERRSNFLCTGVNALVTATCLMLGFANIYTALAILDFQEIYDQMLNGKELPKLSEFVVDHPTLLLFLSAALPIAAIIVFCIRRKRISSIWSLLAILLITTLQLLTMRIALWMPIHQIISEMSSG